jgi:hypothetical protein
VATTTATATVAVPDCEPAAPTDREAPWTAADEVSVEHTHRSSSVPITLQSLSRDGMPK